VEVEVEVEVDRVIMAVLDRPMEIATVVGMEMAMVVMVVAVVTVVVEEAAGKHITVCWIINELSPLPIYCLAHPTYMFFILYRIAKFLN